MSTSSAVNFAVMHTGVALIVGSTVDILMPAYSDSNTLVETALETAIQAGLNGVALVISSRYLSENDPTAGILFGWVLSAAQPENCKQNSGTIINSVYSHFNSLQIIRQTVSSATILLLDLMSGKNALYSGQPIC